MKPQEPSTMQPNSWPSSLMTTNAVASRAMDDFIAQERRARQRVEGELTACLDLLTELAVRLGGETFENMRRDNPGIPKSWKPEDWKAYLLPAANNVLFRSIRWDAPPQPGEYGAQEEIAHLRKQLQDAQARLAIAERASQEKTQASASRSSASQAAPEVRFKPKEAHQAIKVTPQTTTTVLAVERPVLPYMTTLDDVRAVMTNPPLAPAKYEELAKGDRPWHKYFASVYMVGKHGLSAVMEMAALMSNVLESVKPGSNSLRKVFDNMRNYGYFYGETLAVAGLKIGLLRLTPEGAAMYKAVTGNDPVETEWERLERLHRGSEDTAHAAACLLFALQARWRGYQTTLLPELPEAGKARPDFLVEKDGERLAVEVELSQKDNIAKWRNLAALNDGRVAFCTGTQARRERLAGDCKLAKIPGFAVDIERFKATPYGREEHVSPLWMEEWK
jgi:hypothetical protein